MSAPQRRQRPPAQPNILSNAPPSSPPLPLVPAAPCWPSRTPPTPPRRRGGRGGRRAAPRAARLRKAANLQLALARLGCFGVCQSCDHFTALPHADGLRDRALGTLSSRSHEQGVRSSKVCSAARCAQQLLSGVLSSCSQLCSAAALSCAQQLLSRARCAATQPRGLSGTGLRACSSEPRRHFFALEMRA